MVEEPGRESAVFQLGLMQRVLKYYELDEILKAFEEASKSARGTRCRASAQ